jgi:hypothetical protein
MKFKILKVARGLLVLIIAVVAVLAATRPDTFRVQRSTYIQAPPEKVYPLISRRGE